MQAKRKRVESTAGAVGRGHVEVVELLLAKGAAGGPLQSVRQDTENSVLEDLVNCYAQGSDPMIVPERPDHQLPTTP